MNARRRQAEPRRASTRGRAIWGRLTGHRSLARWLGVLLGLAAAVVLLSWGSMRLLDAGTLPIRKIRLEGSLAHVSPDRVRMLVAARVHGGFFGVDVGGVRAAVEGLPWVASASVRRVWPDTLAIGVEEQRPIARWAAGGLVNGHGEVFRPSAASYPTGLPVLSGPENTSPALVGRYREVQALLSPLGLTVTRLSMDKRRAWRLELSNDIKLVLGREDSLARLRRFAEVYPKVLAPRAGDIRRVDLRYTNGFAVAWRHANDIQPAGQQPAGTQQG